jgi:hypothetical protein
MLISLYPNDLHQALASTGGAMKRSGAVKFPNSVQLFKFCQKVLMSQKGSKVNDQDVGSILSFNPSDCSHWKRGEKNVRSVFSLAKLAEVLEVETSLIHDVASGLAGLDEAFYEWQESHNFKQIHQKVASLPPERVKEARKLVEDFVATLHSQTQFATPPLYIPEVLRNFAFITAQPIDMIDKLSRVLRVKPGHYAINYRKGDLKPQTRMGMTKDLARIIFEGERSRFPELGPLDSTTIEFEEILFVASLLAPKGMVAQEMSKLDSRRNIISELAVLFWVPKSLIGFQLQDIVRTGQKVVLPASSGVQVLESPTATGTDAGASV